MGHAICIVHVEIQRRILAQRLLHVSFGVNTALFVKCIVARQIIALVGKRDPGKVVGGVEVLNFLVALVFTDVRGGAVIIAYRVEPNRDNDLCVCFGWESSYKFTDWLCNSTPLRRSPQDKHR